MTAEFNWWLLLLGLAIGAGLTWLVLADTRRREQDLEESELTDEAQWVEARLAEEGRNVPAETAERVIRLHRAYLALVPPSDEREEWWVEMPREEPSEPAEPVTSEPPQATATSADTIVEPPGAPETPAGSTGDRT